MGQLLAELHDGFRWGFRFNRRSGGSDRRHRRWVGSRSERSGRGGVDAAGSGDGLQAGVFECARAADGGRGEPSAGDDQQQWRGGVAAVAGLPATVRRMGLLPRAELHGTGGDLPADAGAGAGTGGARQRTAGGTGPEQQRGAGVEPGRRRAGAAGVQQ